MDIPWQNFGLWCLHHPLESLGFGWGTLLILGFLAKSLGDRLGNASVWLAKSPVYAVGEISKGLWRMTIALGKKGRGSKTPKQKSLGELPQLAPAKDGGTVEKLQQILNRLDVIEQRQGEILRQLARTTGK